MQALCTFFVFPGHSQTKLLTNEIRMQHSFAGFAVAFGFDIFDFVCSRHLASLYRNKASLKYMVGAVVTRSAYTQNYRRNISARRRNINRTIHSFWSQVPRPSRDKVAGHFGQDSFRPEKTWEHVNIN